MEEEHQISSDYTFLFKIIVVPVFLIWIVILWVTIAQNMLLISYLIVFFMILSIVQLLINRTMLIKKVFVNYSTEQFTIRNLNGAEEKISFSELTSYRFKYPRIVKLEFTRNRRRYFLRPTLLEFKPKSFIKQKLDEILSRNSGQNKQ